MYFVIFATLLFTVYGGGNNAFTSRSVHVKNDASNKVYKTASPAQVVIPKSGISIILPDEPPLSSTKPITQNKPNKKQYASLPAGTKPTLVIIDSKKQHSQTPILNITDASKNQTTVEATSQSPSPTESQPVSSKPTAVSVPVEVPTIATPVPAVEVAVTAESVVPVPIVETTATTVEPMALVTTPVPIVEATPVPIVETTATTVEPMALVTTPVPIVEATPVPIVETTATTVEPMALVTTPVPIVEATTTTVEPMALIPVPVEEVAIVAEPSPVPTNNSEAIVTTVEPISTTPTLVPIVETTTSIADIDGTTDEASIDSLDGGKEQVDGECKTVGEIVAKQSNLAVLAAAIESAKLGEFVSDPSAIFTVFAPTDEAFQKVAARLGMTIEQLISNPALPSIVGYHIIPGVAAYSSELYSDQKLSSSIKQDVSVGIPPTGEILINGFEASNTATVITSDIQACKALVHIIGTVLIPDESVDENQLDAQPIEEATLTLSVN
eukprot:TRINITY_DN15292_c0_g1_i1.p2 TRINITY_DN15292_c0_g1~~TRINITY_DN15292_c0_g1_i1.p2  ORF type:complete len:499 (-),score=39.01 TRINITY_DN15292_c0_g1_i1:311-1807(-)